MVMVLPTPLALASVKAPVRLLRLVTLELVVAHVGHVKLPFASSASGPAADTATVPVAFGMVMVLLLVAGVAKVSELVMPPEVLVRLTVAP